MIRMTAEKIAEVAMVGVAKVKKDITKGKLDAESLKDIVRYCQGHRMLSGGLGVWDGVMRSMDTGFIEPEQNEETREYYDYGAVEGIVSGFPEPVESIPLFSGVEIGIIGAIEASGKTRKQAEVQVRKMREQVCADRLTMEHLEELGL